MKPRIGNKAVRAALEYLKTTVVPDGFEYMTAAEKDQLEMAVVRTALLIAATS